MLEKPASRRAKTESGRVQRFASRLGRHRVSTVSGYDDDALSLIEFLLNAVCLKNTEHLVNRNQGIMEIGPRFAPMACR